MKLTELALVVFLILPGAVNAKAMGSSSSTPIAAANTNTNCTGTVVDESGTPIIGATVIVEGTSNGASTSLDGEFTLSNVKKGSTIVISFIGCVTKKVVWSGQSLNITLDSTSQDLNEVVVVGYGTQKKATVTGSIATAKGADVVKVPSINLTNTLAGRLPGLVSYNRSGEPGYDDAGLLIRGASTTGDSSPLVVIDGVADRAGSLARLDANDIEDISILKDASAAIYGSRAANGVILVTTKRGKTDKFTVTYNGNVGLSRPTILPQMCSSAEYAQLINDLSFASSTC
jgi:TonB-dependent SusC/RagA subfamily outer membrane receptor